MTEVIWQAEVSDEDLDILRDMDLDELCEKLRFFWDELLRRKMRERRIDLAIEKEILERWNANRS